MPSTYTNNLGIEKIGTGEQSGTWGNTTNLNFDIIDQAVNGITSFTVASTDTGNPTLLQITEGAISDGRNAFIEFSSSSDLGAAGAVQLTPNDAEKIVYVRNSLQGSQSLILFQGAYNASNDYVLGNGKDAILKFSGTGSGSTVTVVMENPVFEGDVSVGGNITLGGTVDGRNVATDGSKLDGIAPGAQVNVGTNLGNTATGTGLTITSSTGNNTTLPAATTSAWGAMTDDDRVKLDGIAPGAEVNVGTNLGRSVSGTGFTLTSSTGNNTTLPAATTSAWGVMTDDDKVKLDGIAPSANNYVHPSDGGGNRAALTGAVVYSDVTINTLGHVTATAVRTMTLGDLGYTGATNADQYGSWTIAASGTAGTSAITSGNTVTFTGAGATTVTRSGDNITITSSDTNTGTNLGNSATGTSLTVTSSTGSNTNLPAATTSAWGVMTDDDKSKLDGIAPGATANTGDITGVTAGVGLSGGGTSGSVTLTLDMSELTDMTASMIGTDEFIVLDAGADRRKAASEIGLSIFNNDAGFTANSGDITGVTAGVGLSGGGSSGSVTLTLDMSELVDMTTGMVGTDEFIVLDAGADRRKAANEIGLSIFNNDAGFITTDNNTTYTLTSAQSGGTNANPFLFLNASSGTDYNVQLTGSTGIDVNRSSNTNINFTIDLSELTDMTAAMEGTDEFIVLDASADRRKAANEIGLSIFNNDAGFTSNTGDITGVTAGVGLSGGGSSGAVSLAFDGNELTTGTAGNADFFVVVGDDAVSRKVADSSINISTFNNDSGFTSNTGDITNVTASSPLTGGGASGSVSIGLGTTGPGAGTYGSTSNSTKIDNITLDAYGRVTAVTTGATGNGDITGVTAGTGLYGGGTTGAVTINQYSAVSVGGTATIADGTFRTVTSSGSIVTLPASPAAGDTVYISNGPYTNTTIAKNGQFIMGLNENLILDVANIGVTLIFADSTRGWRIM
jgi:uncharacterized protein YjbJ (UPF0337 family)